MRQENAPKQTARLSGAVIALGIVLIGISAVAALSVFQSLPAQRSMMTPVIVTGVPAFAADVEARVTAADPSGGEAIFERYGCTACHNTEYGAGPALAGMGQRAVSRRPDYSAPAYLYESITEPNAFIVPDYPAGVMIQNFKQTIPENDLYVLIAWLLTR